LRPPRDVHVFACRRGPLDLDLIAWLVHLSVPLVVAAVRI
jgi:hypothetical protein